MKTRFQKMAQDAETLRQELIAKINALPDNPNIKSLGGNAFVVNFRDIGNNMSPDHHSWKKQHRMMVKQLQECPASRVSIVFEKWLTTKRISRRGWPYLNIHPSVIDQLQTIWKT